jgi:hypothetical protein
MVYPLIGIPEALLECLEIERATYVPEPSYARTTRSVWPRGDPTAGAVPDQPLLLAASPVRIDGGHP